MMQASADEVASLLARILDASAGPDEIARPARLIEAMRYAMLGGGKRLRPLLVIESAALFGVPRARALMAGAALECVHGYSLIHDDLPAMDNDDLRHGQPTLHRRYDAATAILAGDALLTLAFDLLSSSDVHPDPTIRLSLTRALARAAGIGGMVGGQMLDLAAEGRFGAARQLNEDDIALLQSMKTGALLRFACKAGAVLGGADAEASAALDKYATAIGQAFQIADDLLDIEGDAAVVGKQTGKDAAAGKATFVDVLGRDGARHKLANLIGTAEAALTPFGARARSLGDIARFIAARRA